MEKEDQIKVVLLEPGKLARVAKINTSLESMQKIVGGLIEACYPFDEQICIICNEEGKINGLPLNRAIYSENKKILDIIAGPAFLCDCSRSKFGSLSEAQLKRYEKQFKYPEKFVRINNEVRAFSFIPNELER